MRIRKCTNRNNKKTGRSSRNRNKKWKNSYIVCMYACTLVNICVLCATENVPIQRRLITSRKCCIVDIYRALRLCLNSHLYLIFTIACIATFILALASSTAILFTCNFILHCVPVLTSSIMILGKFCRLCHSLRMYSLSPTMTTCFS